MPTWRILAEIFNTSDFSGQPRIYQKVILNKNVALKAIRTWFVFYNDPSFVNLSMLIYSDKSGLPHQLLHTFDKVWSKSQIITNTNGNKELYFDFNTAPNLKALNTYHFVPSLSSYTGSDSSHVAWVRGVPDPVYNTNLTLTMNNRKQAPFKIGIIGHEL